MFLVDTIKSMSNIDNIYLISRISTLIESQKRKSLMEFGLQSVHLDILLYLSRCNRFSDTSLAVSDYLHLTKGTVSQSIKILIQKQYLERLPDADDKRVTHLRLSTQGKRLLKQLWPPNIVDKALDKLDDKEQLQSALTQLLLQCQLENNHKMFGQCKHCVHNQHIDKQSYFCDLTQQALQADEIELICKEFVLVNES